MLINKIKNKRNAYNKQQPQQQCNHSYKLNKHTFIDRKPAKNQFNRWQVRRLLLRQVFR